jgi:hypothetical protein
MALIYDAQLSPSKPEVLSAWVPGQPWFAGDSEATATILGSYRFDDPDGEVGIETFLVRFGDGPVLQVPFTYRGAPIGEPGLGGTGTPELVTTMEHSVLGRRWVYDGPSDPVYVAAVATATLTGGHEAALLLADGTPLPSRGAVHGSGSASEPVRSRGPVVVGQHGATTRIQAGLVSVDLRRVIDPTEPGPEEAHLLGTWAGSGEPAVLAVVQLSV